MTAPAAFDIPHWQRPTRGQLQVLERIAHGASVAQIAGQLGIDRRSVEEAMSNARGRLRARSDAHAVALAIAHGLVDADDIRRISEAAHALGIGPR